VPNSTHYDEKQRAWIAGDVRYSDMTGDEYIFVPGDPDPLPPGDMRVTRLAFLQRFTLQERMTVRAARSTDPVVEDFMAMVDAATFIDLARPDTEDGVGYLVTKNHITADRAGVVLTAPVQDNERPQGL